MSEQIRQIREEDVESFREAVDIVARERRWLYLTEAPPIASVTEFVRCNISKGYPHLVLVADGRVAGWCTIVPPGRPVQAHVGGAAMGLRPEWRDRGWGTKLMQQALEAAEAFGFTRVELTVYTSNPRVAALYRKLGFVEEGMKRCSVLIDGDYLDEVMMARLR